MKRSGWVAVLLLVGSCAEKNEPTPPPSGTAAKSSPSPVAPPPTPPKRPPVPVPPFDFTAYGDCRSGHDVHGRICASMLRSTPKFVLVSGDLVDWGDSADDWKTFKEITKELRAKTQYLAAAGNHDVSLDGRFEKEFGLEKPYYDRRIGEIHLFILDSNTQFGEAEQLEWLEKKAAGSDARHKIAAFHHPPFSLESFEYEKKPVRERLHPILVKHRFCAAFCGHHHAFSAMVRDGVRYVVTAGGGAILYPLEKSMAQPGDVYREFHHYVGCTVGEKKITARVYDPDGVEAPDLAFTICEHP